MVQNIQVFKISGSLILREEAENEMEALNEQLFILYKEFWLSPKSFKETLTDFKQKRFSFYKYHYDISMTTEKMEDRKHL